MTHIMMRTTTKYQVTQRRRLRRATERGIEGDWIVLVLPLLSFITSEDTAYLFHFRSILGTNDVDLETFRHSRA
jgi:hypothetical protein